MVRGLLVAVLMVLTGGVLWQILQLESTLPAAPIPQASPLSTVTPDARIDALVMMAETQQPTPTKTPKPPITPNPTWTPIPQCGEVTGVCVQWTPTSTPRPKATPTAEPTLGPCGTPLANGRYPRLCLGE
jgi:hypothetical protein